MSAGFKMSLWDDPTFKSAYANLSPEEKYKYEQIGQHMYNTIDYVDPKSVEFELVTQIELMVRDGLDVSMLTDDEKRILVEVRGEGVLSKY